MTDIVSRRGLLQTATARSPWKEAGRICLLGPPSHLIQAHNWNRDWKKVRSSAGVNSRHHTAKLQVESLLTPDSER